MTGYGKLVDEVLRIQLYACSELYVCGPRDCTATSPSSPKIEKLRQMALHARDHARRLGLARTAAWLDGVATMAYRGRACGSNIEMLFQVLAADLADLLDKREHHN